MSEYAARFEPGQAITSQASAAIAAGVLVSVSGTGTVATSAANDTGWVGVAAFAAAASGDKITVLSGGVQRLVASGTVTAGDLVVCATGGKVSSLAAVTTPTAADVTNSRAIVGIALTTAADGVLADIKMER